jgi:hypothetical protein
MTDRVRQPQGSLGPVTFAQVTMNDMEHFKKCSACGAVVAATTPVYWPRDRSNE